MVLTGYDARSGSSRAPPRVARRAPWAGASERPSPGRLEEEAREAFLEEERRKNGGVVLYIEELEKNMRYFDENENKKTHKE